MKVAVLQMVSTGDVAANLRQARALLEQAAQAGAELAVLPEYFCLIGQADTDKLAIREPFGNGPIFKAGTDILNQLAELERLDLGWQLC